MLLYVYCRKHLSSVSHRQSVEKLAAQRAAAAVAAREAAAAESMFMCMSDEALQQKKAQFAAVFTILGAGRPMLAYEEIQPLMKFLQTPHVHSMHRSDNAGWEIAESLAAVVRDEQKKVLASAQFLSISMDESTDVSSKGQMCCHVYYMDTTSWQRVSMFMGLGRVEGGPSAENLHKVVRVTLAKHTGLSAQQLAHRVVMAASDGCNVMMGEHNGVLINSCDHHISVLCIMPVM
jgi:hypothetical protein